MPTTTRLILTLAALLLASASGYTQQPEDQHTPPGDHLHLSAELMNLLKHEMNAIQEGMQALIPAIASGNWKDVATIGNHIRHSYIMQQQLTDTQMEELHQALPSAFLELDQSFHHSAGMLAHAAEMHNAEVVNFYFYKLTDACVACHRKFAGYRFPGLAGDAENMGHQH